jgi:hypothetical protein
LISTTIYKSNGSLRDEGYTWIVQVTAIANWEVISDFAGEACSEFIPELPQVVIELLRKVMQSSQTTF